MKIISKYHDYYDTALAYGLDPSILWIRNEKSLNEQDSKKFFDVPQIIDGINYIGFPFISSSKTLQLKDCNLISFCGILYVSCTMSCERKDILFYSFDDICDFIKNGKDKEQKRRWFDLKKKKIKNFWERSTKTSLSHLYSSCHNVQFSWLLDLHHKYETPVFLCNIRTRQVIINPQLKTIQFAKIKDPFSCFQELSQFISGVLGGMSPKVVEISDEDRKSMHGFDEWSFRKESKKKGA